jgi:hypothetical protein
LHLNYCGIDSSAGIAFSNLLENPRTKLELLSLSGNKLKGVGVSALSVGLASNVVLTSLNLSDNRIDQVRAFL